MAEVYLEQQDVQQGFTKVRIDSLDVQQGFTKVYVQPLKVESIGYEWIEVSYFDTEFGIITRFPENRGTDSIDFVAEIPSYGSATTLNYYFEYWFKSDPDNKFTTPVNTVDKPTRYVSYTATGLFQGVEYEYQAVAYTDDDPSNKKYGGSVEFFLGTLNMEFDEQINSSDDKIIAYYVPREETFNSQDTIRLWDILVQRNYETLVGEDRYNLLFENYLDETLNLQDRYFMIFRSKYDESIRPYVSPLYKKDTPTNWLIAKPINQNFTFESDENNDGIADGWYGENIDYLNTNIGFYGLKPTVQKVKFNGQGKFWTEIEAHGFLLLVLELSNDKPLNFLVYDKNNPEKIYYHKRYEPKDFWVEEITFNTHSQLVFEFSGENVEFYLDNFALMDYNSIVKGLIGFTSFSYSIEGKQTQNSMLSKYVQKEVLETKFNMEWKWITRKQLEILKNMRDSIFLVKTPLYETFALYLESIDIGKSEVMGKQEWEQKYQVSLKVREV